MKKLIYFTAFLVFVVMVSSFASANFFNDFYAKITGYAEFDTSSLNISITANSAPTITWVESIPDQTPNENGINTTTFNFTVNDSDGWDNIDVSTAQARFQLSGEITRLNTSCLNWSNDGLGGVNFTCSIDMWYFDKFDSSWTINVTVQDNIGVSGENSTETFQYNLFPAMAMSPPSLNWTSFGVSDTDQEANDPVTINNTGNDENSSINVTAYNLQGEGGDPSKYIYAANFSVENITSTCTGTNPVNETSTNVTSTILQRGNNSLNYNNATSGQEQLFFCVTAVNSDLITQSYSSAAYGPWEIRIN